MAQVNQSHYCFSNYSFEGRWVSYYHQLRCVLDRNPNSIAELGIGAKVIGNYIKSNTRIPYLSVDFARDLEPDVVGTITRIPLEDKAVDLTCAFEILEHLPFDDVPGALEELARISRRHVVISVPHFGPAISFSVKVPLAPQIRFQYKIPYHPNHVMSGEHYWELGKQGYSTAGFRQLLEDHFIVLDDFVPFNSSYHHFFVCKLR